MFHGQLIYINAKLLDQSAGWTEKPQRVAEGSAPSQIQETTLVCTLT
jgi:hypothetical protein